MGRLKNIWRGKENENHKNNNEKKTITAAEKRQETKRKYFSKSELLKTNCKTI